MKKKNNKPSRLFFVEVERNEGTDNLLKLKSLIGTDVFIVAFVSKTKPIQCFNCNWFHHVADNCYMDSRCLKCGNDHQTRDCGMARLELLNCINCKCAGHLASSRKCPMFPKLKKLKALLRTPTKRKKKPRKKRKPSVPASVEPEGVLAKLNEQQTVPSDPSNTSFSSIVELLKEIKRTFAGISVFILLQQLKKASSTLEKTQILMDALAPNLPLV